MKIFIVDDDPHISALIETILKGSSEDLDIVCLPVENPITRLRAEKVDLMLLDIHLGSLNGLDILQQVRVEFEDLGVILISAQDQVEKVVQGLDLGANDYIRKPFSPQELLARVGANLRVIELQNRLKIMAEMDHVTDLFNMRAMYKKVENAIQSYSSGVIALMMLDLDFFKKVNDENDHLFGTYVLSQVGALLKKSLEGYGIGARYGGDEFMLFWSVETEAELENFVTQLQRDIRLAFFTHESTGKVIQITCSMGVSFAPAQLKPAPKKLVAAADNLLYECKESGRDRFLIKSLV